MKLHDRGRTAHVIKKIFEEFGPEPQRGAKKKILAADILPKLKGSKLTIIKARMAAGVKSKSIAGSWRWLYPTVTLEEALARIARISKNPNSPLYKTKKNPLDLLPQYIETLKEVMKQGNYDLPVKEAIAAMIGHGCPRRYRKIMRLAQQSIPGMSSYWENKRLHWIWITDEVTDWIHDTFLRYGDRVKTDYIYECSDKERGWSRPLIMRALPKSGFVQFEVKDGVQYCWDQANAEPRSEESAAETVGPVGPVVIKEL